MRVYVVTFQLDGDKDELVFSSNDYLIRGLVSYIKRASTRISHQLLMYFEEYQEKEGRPWEWLFTDLRGYGAFEFEKILKPFDCKILCLIVDAGLDQRINYNPLFSLDFKSLNLPSGGQHRLIFIFFKKTIDKLKKI